VTFPVHQLVPSFSYGDAIGNMALHMRGVLREMGHPSEIYARVVHPRLVREARPVDDLRLDERAALIFHFSLGAGLVPLIRRYPGPRIMDYHNITPPGFFAGVNEMLAMEARQGYRELEALAPIVDAAFGHSEFSRRDLDALGYRRTWVLPFATDFPLLSRADPDPGILRRFDDGSLNVLHVGRIVPNKRIEDLIRTMAILRRIEPRTRLLLAGTAADFENYLGSVKQLSESLGVSDIVHFLGHVSFGELRALYKVATVYLCASRHEGFCVPLLEAMTFGAPIVALGAAAVPETLGDAGLLVDKPSPALYAEAVSWLWESPTRRRTFSEAGTRRLTAFSPRAMADRIASIVAEVAA
jgi:glycosyltransferase involved in cell wall biosynthesis